MRGGIILLLVGVCVSGSGLAESASPAQVRVVFAGDIMLDTLPGKLIELNRDPFEDCGPILQNADLTVGNLECVIATRGQRIDKRWTFRGDPRCIPVLARYFGALSIANNHTGDYGPEAFLEQLELLRGKIGVFGGGCNLAEAHEPLIVERGGLRIALLGYNEFQPREFEAGLDRPGVAWSVDEQVLADIARAREEHRAQIVIPMMHWGEEHEPQPNDRQRTLARRMIDAGATCVIGSHPHVTQGAEVYHGCPIIYSLGNFVFDGFEEPEARVGWIARLNLDGDGVAEWDTVSVRLAIDGSCSPDTDIPCPAGHRGSAAVEQRRPVIKLLEPLPKRP